MQLLINAYATHRDPPPLEFPHGLNARRDRSDPELGEHLRGSPATWPAGATAK